MNLFQRLTIRLALSALFFLGPAIASADEILVYTSLEDDEVTVYLKDFERRYPGIDVQLIRDSTGIVTARLLAEKDNPQADVVWGVALTSLLQCDNAGVLRGYNPEGLERVRPKFKDTKHKTARWVGIKAWMTGIAANTIELKKRGAPVPESFADLAKPVYRDCIVMPNPASSGTGFLTVSAILQMMGEEEGWKYLDRLHQNVAVYTHSGSKPAKLAGRGEYPIGISFAYRALKQKAEGEPLAVSFPEEGSGWEIEANALVKKPRTKKAAKTFLDWAISDGAMRAYSQTFAIVSAPQDVPLPDGFPRDPEAQLIENDFDWASMNRDRILREWSRRYEGKSER
jgi:iron(III) transport system substrate-binding protein